MKTIETITPDVTLETPTLVGRLFGLTLEKEAIFGPVIVTDVRTSSARTHVILRGAETVKELEADHGNLARPLRLAGQLMKNAMVDPGLKRFIQTDFTTTVISLPRPGEKV